MEKMGVTQPKKLTKLLIYLKTFAANWIQAEQLWIHNKNVTWRKSKLML